MNQSYSNRKRLGLMVSLVIRLFFGQAKAGSNKANCHMTKFILMRALQTQNPDNQIICSRRVEPRYLFREISLRSFPNDFICLSTSISDSDMKRTSLLGWNTASENFKSYILLKKRLFQSLSWYLPIPVSGIRICTGVICKPVGLYREK